MKLCALCGSWIVRDDAPAGFCGLECAETYFKLHDMEFNKQEKQHNG